MIRGLESFAFGLTFFFLAVNGKIVHRLPVDECTSTFTLAQHLMVDLLINHVVAFWAVVMWFNMFSVQKKKRMGSFLQARRHGSEWAKKLQELKSVLESTDETYLGQFLCCIFFILQVAFRQNLNRI